MSNTFIKATKVVNTALGVLMRETVLPNLVWRDAGGDFQGAYGDTITIRVPAYVTARTRTLRAGTPISVDDLTETSVDVKIDTDVYKGIGVTDENLTLDITDFNTQVLSPILRAVVMGIEDELADTISGATYALTQNFSKTKPLDSILSARRALNDCYVPASGRVLAVGSEIEQYILQDLAKRNVAAPASQDALTDATLATNFGGFQVVQSNALAPDEAYAFHKTAFVLSSKAPVVPDGASWGASQSAGGFAIRVIKDYDPLYLKDRCIGSCWIGSEAVYDDGDLNNDGQFVPEDGSGSGSPILVRAVKLSIPSGS
jgi:hypothetical protein